MLSKRTLGIINSETKLLAESRPVYVMEYIPPETKRTRLLGSSPPPGPAFNLLPSKRTKYSPSGSGSPPTCLNTILPKMRSSLNVYARSSFLIH